MTNGKHEREPQWDEGGGNNNGMTTMRGVTRKPEQHPNCRCEYLLTGWIPTATTPAPRTTTTSNQAK